MAIYTDPKRALRLLDELETLGFNDKAFAVVHHFGEKERIQSFRNYCENRPEVFREDGTNADVLRRLEAILRMYWGAAVTSKSESMFIHLANAAVVQFPVRR